MDPLLGNVEALMYGRHANGFAVVDRPPRLHTAPHHLPPEYPPAERAEMHEQRRRGQPSNGEGRHRAIRQHAFVQWRGDDKHGCGLMEFDNVAGREVRCGYYRWNHPTMLIEHRGELRRKRGK